MKGMEKECGRQTAITVGRLMIEMPKGELATSREVRHHRVRAITVSASFPIVLSHITRTKVSDRSRGMGARRKKK